MLATASPSGTTKPASAVGCLQLALTPRQRELIELIEYRRRNHLPTVQRDLAEAMGIRRDSLNKLLARTRQVLLEAGLELAMPPRQRESHLPLLSLDDFLE